MVLPNSVRKEDATGGACDRSQHRWRWGSEPVGEVIPFDSGGD